MVIRKEQKGQRRFGEESKGIWLEKIARVDRCKNNVPLPSKTNSQNGGER